MHFYNRDKLGRPRDPSFHWDEKLEECSNNNLHKCCHLSSSCSTAVLMQITQLHITTQVGFSAQWKLSRIKFPSHLTLSLIGLAVGHDCPFRLESDPKPSKTKTQPLWSSLALELGQDIHVIRDVQTHVTFGVVAHHCETWKYGRQQREVLSCQVTENFSDVGASHLQVFSSAS